MEKRLFGLCMKNARRLPYQLVIRNNISNKLKKNCEMAKKNWIAGFLGRHPDVSVYSPEATSGARAMGFNCVAFTQFHTLLTECIDKYKLTVNKIFNCDETAITVNPKGHSKILATKVKRQVGIITFSERRQSVAPLT
ncbi:hypothetical protein Trydic_g3250 [Trypoxylus dichotomus]